MRLSKKLMVLFLAVITVMSVAACGGGGSGSGKVYYLNHKDGDGFTDLIKDSFDAKAKSAGVNQVVFDRNGRLYHGKVKVFADAAREAGLQF